MWYFPLTVERRIRAEIDGKPIQPLLTCKASNIVEATPVPDEDALSLGPPNAIPRSVVILTDEPDALHQRTVIVTSDYDELQMDTTGFGVAGMTVAAELYEPLPAAIYEDVEDRVRHGDPYERPASVGRRVFLSYASETRADAEKLHAFLTGLGHSVWFDIVDL